ncbi:MAG TPA: sialidase family protein [Candidatus Dormibacteraeota bacterium]|nr:sialidase family protein [Candidatus Dormibacteraeota bacterium]
MFVSALTSALTLISSSTAVAAITPVLISGPSPYAVCSSHDNQLTGRTYLNAEVEPQVAVHGSNVIAVFHQDRKSNGGAHGIGVGFSTNGGASWSETPIALTACSPDTPLALNNMWRASDPWVSFGPDGTAYFSALSFNVSVPNNANAVAAARSTDGGATWDHIQPIPGSLFQTADSSTDKNSTTADPTLNKTAYTVWDTLVLATDNPDDNPKTQAYTGPAFFSKTTDGGKTWSRAKVIVDTGNRQQTIGNIIVVDPRPGHHTLYNFTDLLLPPNTPFRGTHSNAQLAFVKSTDGGDTWTQPQVIAPFDSLGVIDPNTGRRARVGDGLEEVAIDPANGKLYVVYESSSNFLKNSKQSAASFDDEILLVSSSDGGATWTAPQVIHQLANGMPTFTPTIAVNGGRVAVTYYDSRNLQPGQTANWPTDYWVEFSTDGGATFGNEQHIGATFDLATAPVARGFFLGDYEALQPSGSGFLAVYVKTNCDAPFPAGNPLCAPASSNTTATSNTNPTDVFSASIP